MVILYSVNAKTKQKKRNNSVGRMENKTKFSSVQFSFLQLDCAEEGHYFFLISPKTC